MFGIWCIDNKMGGLPEVSIVGATLLSAAVSVGAADSTGAELGAGAAEVGSGTVMGKPAAAQMPSRTVITLA